MKINKALLVTMKPGVHIDAKGLIGHSAEMNKRIGKNIAANEKSSANSDVRGITIK